MAARIRGIYAAPGRAGVAGAGARASEGDQTIASFVVIEAVVFGEVGRVVILIYPVPGVIAGCRIEQDDVVYWAPPSGAAVRGGSLPNYFVAEIVRAEYAVHQEFEVVAGGGVAVEVDAAGGF